jgi:hypothetical protein
MYRYCIYSKVPARLDATLPERYRMSMVARVGVEGARPLALFDDFPFSFLNAHA